jgi:hypothetical protein
MAVFWVVAPCSLVEVYQRFRGPCCLHHQGSLWWCATTRRQPSSYSPPWEPQVLLVIVYCRELLAPPPPREVGPTLVGCQRCLFSQHLFAATLHICRPSPPTAITVIEKVPKFNYFRYVISDHTTGMQIHLLITIVRHAWLYECAVRAMRKETEFMFWRWRLW